MSKPTLNIRLKNVFSGTRRLHQLPLLYPGGIPPTQKFWEFSAHRAHNFGGLPGRHVIRRDYMEVTWVGFWKVAKSVSTFPEPIVTRFGVILAQLDMFTRLYTLQTHFHQI